MKYDCTKRKYQQINSKVATQEKEILQKYQRISIKYNYVSSNINKILANFEEIINNYLTKYQQMLIKNLPNINTY